MSIFNLFLTLLFVFMVATSCLPNRGTELYESEGCSGNFHVDQVKGTLSFSDETVLPEKFTLQLEACIRSRGRIETQLPGFSWAISNDKENFNIAAKNINESTNLVNNKENKVIRLNTVDDGCINWTEEYDYAYNNKSQWILITRYIKGLSNAQPGICKIPLAVNPWLQLEEHRKNQVADYRSIYSKDNNLLKGRVLEEEDGLDFLKRKKKEEKDSKVDIIIDTLALHMDSSTAQLGKRFLKGNTIKANLRYIIQDINGSQNSNNNKIKAGDFEVEPHLLILISQPDTDNSNTIKTKYIKMNENNSSAVKASFINDKLKSSPFDWEIPYENYNLQTVALYLKVTPTGETAKRVNSFEGVYTIGDSYTKVVSNHIHELHLDSILSEKYNQKTSNRSRNASFDANSFNSPSECFSRINPKTPGTSILNTCISSETSIIADGSLRDGFDLAGWSVQKLNLRFLQVKKENWLSRTVGTTVETSIREPLSNNEPITSKNINIEIIDLSTGEKTKHENIRTDTSGNISFNIFTKQNWYKRQKYFLKIINFENTTKELSKKKIVVINPWDYGFTHGYDVNYNTDIRTTCLETEKIEEKETLSKLLKKKIETITDKQIEVIHKLFCHDQEDTSEDTSTITAHWINIFETFKETLAHILNKPSIDIDTLYTKFISSKKVKRPTSHIHLFRSINKFPTLLIDDSLNRELYYNVRFKLSPRVVRHDDIAIGQQNKGPLRDGVYVFQMALLKNNQERIGGNEGKSQNRNDFPTQHPNLNTQTSGTASLPCHQNCTKDDFLIPPTNLPIIIRDGMVKTDVLTLIKREHLLFANSKNILVFRVIPANPESIICTDKTKNCTEQHADTFEAAFDWPETIKTIKPADPSQYDMHFYTYKTPFIPSLWSNWTITHETNITFDTLKTMYENLSDGQFDYDSLEKNELKTEYRKLSDDDIQDVLSDRSVENNSVVKFSDVEKINIILSDEEKVKQHQQALQSKINFEALEAKDAYITKAAEELNTTDTHYRETVESAIKRKKEERNNIHISETIPQSSVLSPSLEKLTQQEESVLDPEAEESAEVNAPPADTLEGQDYCTKIQIGENNQLTEEYPNEQQKDRCNIDTNKEDMSQKHIKQFASTNTLCTIHINSDSHLTEKNCGSVSSPEELQNSFLDDLNIQINFINDTIKKTREAFNYSRQRNHSIMMLPSYQNRLNTLEEQPVKLIEEAFQKEHRHSFALRNKIKNMPELPLLDADSLEKIITSDFNNITDTKTGAFLHALCGFWFENFFSHKYTNKELLLDGLRNTIKQSFYYKLRGIPTESADESDNTLMDTFKEDLKNTKEKYEEHLSTEYNKHLEIQKTEGSIDDLHKWVNNEGDYGFDSEFNKKLQEIFQTISSQHPFKNIIPSWIDEKTDQDSSKNTFNTENYLSEPIKRSRPILNNIITYRDDFHPFRKCIFNPTHFFGFEKKIIVGKVNNKIKYDQQGGEIITLNVSNAFLMNTQRDQGANQQFETSLSATLTVLSLPLLAYGIIGGAIPLIARMGALGGTALNKSVAHLGSKFKAIINDYSKGNKSFFMPTTAGTILAFSGMLGGSGYGYRTYEGTGKRRWLSVQVIETAELLAEYTPINIGLKNYHECLVIRPRFSAFESHSEKYNHIWAEENKVIKHIYEQMGILLCTKGKEERASIQEDYYYIYSNYPVNGITIDPSSHRNKPFVISLRGQKAYEQFLSNLSCHVSETSEPIKQGMDCRDTRGKYENLFLKHIEFAHNLKKGFDTPKMFHLTGDLPGVYSKYEEPEDRSPKVKTNALHDFINWFSERQFMDIDLEKIVRKEPQNHAE